MTCFAAQRQYRDLERILREELDAAPSAATRALIEGIRRSGVGRWALGVGATTHDPTASAQRSAPEAQRPTPNAQRPMLEPIGGAMALDSPFYVVRRADEEFRVALERGDSIVLIKGPRQVGKTSLLARGLHRAREAGARTALIDVESFNATHLASAETLLLALAQGLADRLFACPFGSEVFGLFRSWHNERALDPSGPWTRLTLAIGYATEAHLFISDLNKSPFNVGTRLTLEDFTAEQVAELNRRYGAPLHEEAELTRYYDLVGGHPYLIGRGLHEMASRAIPFSELEARAGHSDGIFGDHLRRLTVALRRDADLCEVVRQTLQGRPCRTPEAFYRLRTAGVLTGESEREARFRCRLYATYLDRHLP